MSNPIQRCPRCESHPLAIDYHDTEWGVPVHDDTILFEFLILEGAQAGLSRNTILNKRENYHHAFAKRDPLKVACFGTDDIERLLNDPGIVRNKLKIHGAINNAQIFLTIQQEFGSFDQYIWSFTDYASIDNQLTSSADHPTTSPLSDRISADLKARGMKFVGSTIIYSYLEAIGVINNHLISCWRYAACNR